MTKRVVSLLILLAACSPFAAGGDDDTPTDAGGTLEGGKPSGTLEAGATSGGTNGGTSGATSGGEAGDASPASTGVIAWEGDEVATWKHANISPFNAAETTDCCGSCLNAPDSCRSSVTKSCDDTDAHAENGVGRFVSGPSATTEGHARDGFYAWREFEVTPGTGYDVKFKFTKLAAFGADPANAAWKVTLYDGPNEVFSKGDIVPCAAAGGCTDDSQNERSFGPAFLQDKKATIVIMLGSGAGCTIGGVTSVEADVDYVHLVPHAP